MTDDGYTTPEGHWLPRPLLLPDARSFSDVLEYVAEWDHETMSHRSGELPAGSPRPEPRYIPEEKRQHPRRDSAPRMTTARNEIGPYCTVDLSQLGGKRHRGIAVRATDAVIEAVRQRIVTDDDHLSFQVIGHERSERALVILQHGHIIGSHWLAYVDPATIPPYPYVERDRRIDEVCAAIRARDADRMGVPGHVPFRRDVPGGIVEISCRTIPRIKARVYPDGSMDRTWSDGSTHHEPAGTRPAVPIRL